MKQKPLFTATLQMHYGITDADILHRAWDDVAPHIRGAGDVAARDWAALHGVQPVAPLPPELHVATLSDRGFNSLACLMGLQEGSAKFNAARAHLVRGLGVGDAARTAGTAYSNAHKAVTNARDVIDLCKKVVDSMRGGA